MRQLYMIIGTIVGISACVAVILYMQHLATLSKVSRRERIQHALDAYRMSNARRQQQRDMYKHTVYSNTMNDVMTVCRDPFHSPHDKLLYVAKLAARGIYPAVAPDPDLARTCCRAILMTTKNPVTCARARYILYDLHVEDHDIEGTPIDESVRTLVRDITETAYMNQELTRKEKHIHVPRPVFIDNDPQNSHDSTVVSEVRRTISRLRPSSLSRTDIESMIYEADVSDEA